MGLFMLSWYFIGSGFMKVDVMFLFDCFMGLSGRSRVKVVFEFGWFWSLMELFMAFIRDLVSDKLILVFLVCLFL